MNRALGYCRVGQGLSGVGAASVGQGVTSCREGCGFQARGVVLQPLGAAVGGDVILSRAVRKATTEQGLGQGDH